jgi:hypothetical protein
MTKDEALKLVQEALVALENISTALREDDVLGSDIELMLNTIASIHKALAQTEERWLCRTCNKSFTDLTIIHTCTPPRKNP